MTKLGQVKLAPISLFWLGLAGAELSNGVQLHASLMPTKDRVIQVLHKLRGGG